MCLADNSEEELYTVPHARHIMVRDGERVVAGDQLTDGSVSPHDILRVKGEKAVQEFLLQEIQKVLSGAWRLHPPARWA